MREDSIQLILYALNTILMSILVGMILISPYLHRINSTLVGIVNSINKLPSVVSGMVVVGVKEGSIRFMHRVAIIYKSQYERFPLVGTCESRESHAPNTPPQVEDTPRFFL